MGERAGGCVFFSRRVRESRTWIATVAAISIPFLCSCGRGSDAEQAKAPNASPPATSVELSREQLRAIKIARASIYWFALEKDAVGSITFADDPDWVPAESTLLAAAASYDQAREELAREKSLGVGSGIARKDLEQAKASAQTAEAAYKAARDALRALGQTDAEIDRLVRAGRIGRSQEHSAVKWVVAGVVESDSPLLHSGEPIKVSVSALPGQVFEGTVFEVYGAVDPNAHRVTLRAPVTDPNDVLRPGMLADVTIQVQKPQSSVGLPENGIVREGDGTMTAWVTTDRRHFVQRVVTVGLREGRRVQILRGVRSGELVVTDGAIFLHNMLQAPADD